MRLPTALPRRPLRPAFRHRPRVACSLQPSWVTSTKTGAGLARARGALLSGFPVLPFAPAFEFAETTKSNTDTRSLQARQPDTVGELLQAVAAVGHSQPVTLRQSDGRHVQNLRCLLAIPFDPCMLFARCLIVTVTFHHRRACLMGLSLWQEW